MAQAFDVGNAGSKRQNWKFASIFLQLSVEQLPEHDDARCLAVSDFNAKRGFMARSEAHVFTVIPKSYTKPLTYKVHFEPKSAFEGVML